MNASRSFPASSATCRRSRSIALATVLSLTILPLARAVTVDGVRDADEYDAALHVQTETTTWGENNTLANIHVKQEGGTLNVFLGGRTWDNAFLLFIDSKPGGNNFIPNNLIADGGDAYQINNLGSDATSGMTFEEGFEPDYAVRVAASNAGTSAWVNFFRFATGEAFYLGEAESGTISGQAVTAGRVVWQSVSGPYADVDRGVELALSISGLGVPTGSGQPVKVMAMLVNGGSTWGSNQTLGSLPAGSGDLRDGLKTTNFDTVADPQTLETTVENSDLDGDGDPDATDPDDDNDGLEDTVETNTGIFVSASDTGSDPRQADTDADGYNDGAEVDGTALGYASDPNIANHTLMAVPGDFNLPTAWDPTGSSMPSNSMTQAGTSLTDQYAWTLDFDFRTPGTRITYKFAAGTWAQSWGGSGTPGTVIVGGSNLTAQVGASGLNRFTLNTATRTCSFERAVFADDASFLAGYGLAGDPDGDADGDGVPNAAERTANTDPTAADSDGDGTTDGADADPLVPAPRDVVFQVNMRPAIFCGYFDPNLHQVSVIGQYWSDWATDSGLLLSDDDLDGVYTGTVSMNGYAGLDFGPYKFFSDSGAPNSGYETGDNRTTVLGPSGVTQTLEVATFRTSNAYGEWADAHGLTTANVAGSSDPDGDGATNLQEFIFGGNPMAPDTISSQIGTSGSYVRVTFIVRTADVTYWVEQNPDLGASPGWTDTGAYLYPDPDQTGVPGDYQRVWADILPSGPRSFLRLQGSTMLLVP